MHEGPWRVLWRGEPYIWQMCPRNGMFGLQQMQGLLFDDSKVLWRWMSEDTLSLLWQGGIIYKIYETCTWMQRLHFPGKMVALSENSISLVYTEVKMGEKYRSWACWVINENWTKTVNNVLSEWTWIIEIHVCFPSVLKSYLACCIYCI